MPDGEIKYTQHTDSYRNVSLEGRLPNTEKAEGDQNLRIVRPHPDCTDMDSSTGSLVRQSGRVLALALAVPTLVVLGVVGVVAHMAAEEAHFQAQRAACGDLPAVSAAMYGAAFGALACSQLAGVVSVWLLVSHRQVFAVWQGQVAGAAASLGVLPFLFQCYVVWSLFQPSPCGIVSCAG